jgi:hypothetical protein
MDKPDTLLAVKPLAAGQPLPVPAIGRPPGDVLLADRGHLLSRMTFRSENHHRAGHTGRVQAATLADMGRCRMGFRLRGFSAGWRSGADAARERQQVRP